MDHYSLNTTISENRTNNYLSQLKSSFLFKILAIICSFLVIPIMIKYLGNERYGVWSTLLSIASWILLFDIGLGSGLRNKISEALAKNNIQEAQIYISTGYTAIGFISLILLTGFLILSNFISWQSVFNTYNLSNNELKLVVNMTITFLLVNFWLSIIHQIFNGLQKSSIVIFNQFLSNLLSLGFTYILYSYFESSLIKLAFAYGLSLVITNLAISIWFFKNNIDFLPKIKLYSKKNMKAITSIGLQFFIIQIAVIVIFTTDKILITQLFGPEYVTNYDLVFKLFSTITIAHSLLMYPLWSAYSDAFHRNDFYWIKRVIKQQLRIYLLFIVATAILGYFAKPIILLWIGTNVAIDSMLIMAMGSFILVSIWNNIFAYFINATNQLKIQVTTSVLAIIINIPLSIFIVKYFHTGTSGIIIGTTLSLSLFAVFGSIQTFKYLKGNICTKN